MERDVTGWLTVINQGRHMLVYPSYPSDDRAPDVLIATSVFGDDTVPVSRVEIPVSEQDFTPRVAQGEVDDVDELLTTVHTGVDLFIGYLLLPRAVRQYVRPFKVYDQLRTPEQVGRALRESNVAAANTIEEMMRLDPMDPEEGLVFIKHALDEALKRRGQS